MVGYERVVMSYQIAGGDARGNREPRAVSLEPRLGGQEAALNEKWKTDN
jgi:hypothetical protein